MYAQVTNLLLAIRSSRPQRIEHEVGEHQGGPERRSAVPQEGGSLLQLHVLGEWDGIRHVWQRYKSIGDGEPMLRHTSRSFLRRAVLGRWNEWD
jgi:hypothetical protein